LHGVLEPPSEESATARGRRAPPGVRVHHLGYNAGAHRLAVSEVARETGERVGEGDVRSAGMSSLRGGAGRAMVRLRKNVSEAIQGFFPHAKGHKKADKQSIETGRKWLRKSLAAPSIVSYYPKNLRDNLVRTREEVIAARKYEIMMRLGKTAPKKGAKYKGKKK